MFKLLLYTSFSEILLRPLLILQCYGVSFVIDITLLILLDDVKWLSGGWFGRVNHVSPLVRVECLKRNSPFIFSPHTHMYFKRLKSHFDRYLDQRQSGPLLVTTTRRYLTYGLSVTLVSSPNNVVVSWSSSCLSVTFLVL